MGRPNVLLQVVPVVYTLSLLLLLMDRTRVIMTTPATRKLTGSDSRIKVLSILISCLEVCKSKVNFEASNSNSVYTLIGITSATTTATVTASTIYL